MKALFICYFTAISSLAVAGWIEIYKKSDGTTYHILDDSIAIDGTTRHASILIIYPSNPSVPIHAVVVRNDIDCTSSRFKINEVTNFDKDAKKINSYEAAGVWTDAVNNSPGNAIVKAACNLVQSNTTDYETQSKTLAEERRKAEEQEAERERQLKQADYYFCVAGCSAQPGATLLSCMAQCGKKLTR